MADADTVIILHDVSTMHEAEKESTFKNVYNIRIGGRFALELTSNQFAALASAIQTVQRREALKADSSYAQDDR